MIRTMAWAVLQAFAWLAEERSHLTWNNSGETGTSMHSREQLTCSMSDTYLDSMQTHPPTSLSLACVMQDSLVQSHHTYH